MNGRIRMVVCGMRDAMVQHWILDVVFVRQVEYRMINIEECEVMTSGSVVIRYYYGKRIVIPEKIMTELWMEQK